MHDDDDISPNVRKLEDIIQDLRWHSETSAMGNLITELEEWHTAAGYFTSGQWIREHL